MIWFSLWALRAKVAAPSCLCVCFGSVSILCAHNGPWIQGSACWRSSSQIKLQQLGFGWMECTIGIDEISMLCAREFFLFRKFVPYVYSPRGAVMVSPTSSQMLHPQKFTIQREMTIPTMYDFRIDDGTADMDFVIDWWEKVWHFEFQKCLAFGLLCRLLEWTEFCSTLMLLCDPRHWPASDDAFCATMSKIAEITGLCSQTAPESKTAVLWRQVPGLMVASRNSIHVTTITDL